MKNSEIRKTSLDKIEVILNNQKMKYIRIKYNHKIELDKKPNYIKYSRRYIARMLTILHERKNK